MCLQEVKIKIYGKILITILKNSDKTISYTINGPLIRQDFRCNEFVKSTIFFPSREATSPITEFLNKNYDCRTIGPTLYQFLPDLNTLTEISESM
jgi:hypothetical protein